MAEMKLVENGVRRKRRSNPKKRRNTTTITQARATAKRNGFKLVKAGTPTRTVSNPKRRRRRVTRRRKNNGLLGDTKETVTAVASLGGGMVASKIAGGLATPFTQRFLTPLGVGNYAQIITEAVLAVVVISPIARKIAGAKAAKFAMLGGLTSAGLNVLDMFMPDTLPLNPFALSNSQPVILAPSISSANEAVRGGALSGRSYAERPLR